MKRLTGHIFLIGFMGVGKTSISKVLCRRLGVRDLDTDEMIVEQEGMPISQIFEEQGEAAFRQMETELLDKIAKMSPCVVSWDGSQAGKCCEDEKSGEDSAPVCIAGNHL